jgi:hypothetical protein
VPKDSLKKKDLPAVDNLDSGVADTLGAIASALESGYLPLDAVAGWAQATMENLDQPPDWLVDLVQVSDTERAVSLLWKGWKQSLELSAPPSPLKERSGELYLGFLFLRYEAGELGLQELLKKSGEKSDLKDCEIDCSAFYLLLNELDGRGPTIPDNTPFPNRLQKLFAPFAQMARNHLPLLPKRNFQP